MICPLILGQRGSGPALGLVITTSDRGLNFVGWVLERRAASEFELDDEATNSDAESENLDVDLTDQMVKARRETPCKKTLGGDGGGSGSDPEEGEDDSGEDEQELGCVWRAWGTTDTQKRLNNWGIEKGLRSGDVLPPRTDMYAM